MAVFDPRTASTKTGAAILQAIRDGIPIKWFKITPTGDESAADVVRPEDNSFSCVGSWLTVDGVYAAWDYAYEITDTAGRHLNVVRQILRLPDPTVNLYGPENRPYEVIDPSTVHEPVIKGPQYTPYQYLPTVVHPDGSDSFIAPESGVAGLEGLQLTIAELAGDNLVDIHYEV